MRSGIQANKREVTLCGGKSTFGKSCFMGEYLFNYNRVIIHDPLGEHEGKYFRHVEDIRRHIAGNPMYRVMTDNLLEFEKLCKLVRENATTKKRIVLALDEITRFELDHQLKKFPHFRQIVYAGGHDGIDLIIIAQRLSTIPISCRSQWTQIITFHQDEPDDLDYLKSVSRDEIMLQVPMLLPREYIKITNRTIEKLRS